jgi:hypothetical protein
MCLQLRVVRSVAVLGGLLQIFLFMCMCGFTVSVCFYNFDPHHFRDFVIFLISFYDLKLTGNANHKRSSDFIQFCSYVVVKLQKGFLLVLSFLCLQQQWYDNIINSVPFSSTHYTV